MLSIWNSNKTKPKVSDNYNLLGNSKYSWFIVVCPVTYFPTSRTSETQVEWEKPLEILAVCGLDIPTRKRIIDVPLKLHITQTPNSCKCLWWRLVLCKNSSCAKKVAHSTSTDCSSFTDSCNTGDLWGKAWFLLGICEQELVKPKTKLSCY